MSRAIDFNRYCLIWSMLLMTWEDIHVSVTICRNFRLFYFVFFKFLIYQDEHWYVVLIVYALVYFLQFISLKKTRVLPFTSFENRWHMLHPFLPTYNQNRHTANCFRLFTAPPPSFPLNPAYTDSPKSP